MKILIFGLPGAGKTTLAEHLQTKLTEKGLKFVRINGGDVRRKYDDWDFSNEGRFRQADHMNEEADLYEDVILDFVAPFRDIRRIINADYEIWMDVVQQSDHPDTDAAFEMPMIHEIDDVLVAYPTNTVVDAIVFDICDYYREVKVSESLYK